MEQLKRTINRLRSLEKMPLKKEWNKIAEKEMLLSTASLKYETGKNFSELYREVKR